MQDEATAQPEPHYLSRADAAAYVAKKFGFPWFGANARETGRPRGGGGREGNQMRLT